MVYTYNEILFSFFLIKIFESFSKKKEILPHVTTWMNLEDIMISEINQSEKDKYCMIPIA